MYLVNADTEGSENCEMNLDEEAEVAASTATAN